MPAPFPPLRVLDLTRILAGPFCCQVLADLGCDVVKIERPGAGDDTRAWGPPFVGDEGPSAYFVSCNRGKRSLALDLSTSAGRDVLADLVRQADVLVENFLPDVAARLGLSPANLKQLNPRLVAVSITGYGHTSPWSDRPGYDLAVQALSGMLAITGETEGSPQKVGVAITDIVAGLYAAVSIFAGLRERDQGLGGQHFDLALLDCTLASLVNVAQSTLVTGQRPKRWGNAHAQIVPYGVFATADGDLVLAIGNDAQYQRFCLAAGRADLASEPRFATNPLRVAARDELVPQVAELVRLRSTAQWEELLTRHDVPHSPVLALDEALSLPHTQVRGMVQKVRDEAGQSQALLGNPIRRSAGHWPEPLAPPALGQHTDIVLREWLTYDDSQINALRVKGVVA